MSREDLPVEQLLEVALESTLLDVHTCMPAEVLSYDETKKRADVKPVVRRPLRDADDRVVHEALPTIPNVPVAWPGAGGFELHFPLAAGDTGFLIFSEVPTGTWFQRGGQTDAGHFRRFELDSPIFLPFRRAPSNTTGANLRGPSPFVVGDPASAEFVALANLVLDRLDTIVNSFNSHTHPVPGITAGMASTNSTAPTTPMVSPDPVAGTALKSE